MCGILLDKEQQEFSNNKQSVLEQRKSKLVGFLMVPFVVAYSVPLFRWNEFLISFCKY